MVHPLAVMTELLPSMIRAADTFAPGTAVPRSSVTAIFAGNPTSRTILIPSIVWPGRTSNGPTIAGA